MLTISMQTKIQSSISEQGFKVALLLREIEAKINARKRNQLEVSGLTFPQITVIKIVAHSGEITITALARELSTSKATVVGIVDRLEAVGLLERRRNSLDRREVNVGFPESAKQKISEIRTIVDDAFVNAFEDIPESRLLEFEHTLEAILESL